MVICDSGPLIAMIDANDPHHTGVAELIASLGTTQLLTTVACITEAMYFLHKFGGWAAQRELLLLLNAGGVQVDDGIVSDLPRIARLMEAYQNVPMDFADASLVALAERLGIRRLMTIDRHFYAYRLQDGEILEVLFPSRR